MRTKSPIKLKPKERKLLEQLVGMGTEKARRITRARILLMADEDKTDTYIIESLQVARNAATQVRSRYIHEGVGSRGG